MIAGSGFRSAYRPLWSVRLGRHAKRRQFFPTTIGSTADGYRESAEQGLVMTQATLNDDYPIRITGADVFLMEY